jgi:hypothetical protein
VTIRPAVAIRAAGALAALVVLAAGTAGCGSSAASKKVASLGDGPAPAATATAATGKDREAALLDFAKCMRANGVPSFPDPTVDADGNPRLQFQRLDRGDPAVRKAQQACRGKLANARPSFSPEQRQKMQDALLAYAKCMRTNGYDLPDPTFDPAPGQGRNGRPAGGPFGTVNRNDPAFKKADPLCRDKLGDFGRRRGGGPRD